MNNDLISKAELFNKLAVIKAPPEANEYKGEVYSVIQAMETEDAVAVVRCKDCKHRTELPYVDKDTHEPIYDCGYNISPLWGEENGYCDHGKRRE